VVNKEINSAETSPPIIRVGSGHRETTRAVRGRLETMGGDNDHHGITKELSGRHGVTRERSGRHGMTRVGPRVVVSSPHAVASFAVPGEMPRHRSGLKPRTPSISEVDSIVRRMVTGWWLLNVSR
jgi:hypothetical protein